MADEEVNVEQPKENLQTAQDRINAQWEEDFSENELSIPYSREEDKPVVEDEAKSAVDTAVEEQEYEAPAPLVTVEDPGDYTPKDYSFDIEIKGEKHHVTTADEAADLADKFAEDLGAKDLITLTRKAAQIDINEERDRAEYDKTKEAFDSQVGAESQRQEEVNNLAKEIEYLVASGKIPEITDPAVKQRWLTDADASKDAEFIKNPGIKEQVELVNRLVEERERRIAAGLSSNVSALDVFKDIENDRLRADNKAQEDGDARKTAGARVAGVSAGAQAPYVPAGIAVGNPRAFQNQGDIWAD